VRWAGDLDAAPEPRNLRRLKAEVRTRWGTVPLIDMLKEAVLRTGCLAAATSAAGRGDLPPEVLAERLMLAIYAYGTNTGIRAIAGSAQNGHSEDDIRYVCRRYLTTELARTIAIEIANATFAARAHQVWGAGSTAVASDSTHFGAFDQNIFTEWHSRYGGRGVLIYWHVERKSMAIHSQLLTCTASEVAAMVEGAMRHGTTMEVEGNYVDSHGHFVTWIPHEPWKRPARGGPGRPVVSSRVLVVGSGWRLVAVRSVSPTPRAGRGRPRARPVDQVLEVSRGSARPES
jgi:hypothetical protein